MGNIKGVGYIYKQTFIDTYSSVAFDKLYTSKHALTAAVLLYDLVIPFFEQHEIPVLCLLTERGTKYKGRPEQHDYELYLQLEGIEHSKTQLRHSQSNGIIERLHRTMQDEFYAVTFRTKAYDNLDNPQHDLETWAAFYNLERTHTGRYC